MTKRSTIISLEKEGARSPLILQKDGPVCTLMINNPEKRNALTPECFSKIIETFDTLSRDDEARVIIIRGTGDAAFSSGADITAMPGGEKADSPEGMHGGAASASEAIRRCPFPVIAMLKGYTLGAGCILAMSCDIRIAARNVKMGVPTSKMGLVSDYGTFRRFFTVLGYSTALEIFLTGRTYEGDECLQMGLVNHLVESGQLESFVYNFAREMVECAPLSVKGAKFILSRIAENPVLRDEDLKAFQALRSRAFHSEDHEEAKRAFKEKRKPRFHGR
ncbi:MAG: enoyl-CoA hydratase/isomerase family protein [Desulfobacterales bacterium]|nr:enoyl-CoA hydratase/isomerase family protein [Desulfobacterales bacterium]